MADALTDMEQELQPDSDINALAKEIAQAYGLDPARLLDTFIKKNGDPKAFPEKRASHQKISQEIDSHIAAEKKRAADEEQERIRKAKEARARVLNMDDMRNWTPEQWARYDERQAEERRREKARDDRLQKKHDRQKAPYAVAQAQMNVGNYMDVDFAQEAKNVMSGRQTRESFIKYAMSIGVDAIESALYQACRDLGIEDTDVAEAAFKKSHKQSVRQYGEQMGQDLALDGLFDAKIRAAEHGPEDKDIEGYLKGVLDLKDLSDKEEVANKILAEFAHDRGNQNMREFDEEEIRGLLKALRDLWPMHWAWFEKKLGL